MTSSTRSNSRPAGRLFVLLVLVVLAGVLGMHALQPGGAPNAGVGHEMVMPGPSGAPHADGTCAHTGGGSDHLVHADGTCAAAGTGSAYMPPALAASAVLDVPAVSCLMAAMAGSPHDDRAPPDLFELQLLRI
ncbi:membrane protein [Streptomyces sp. AS58]|uniref:DUF6153 family protein n=1 Tax=Streptomyces sp. AS58 TaxID=1519489 RepID=UPI0006AFCA1B|nr:DUF6153 family protein [Streptomyces sp. AS58]KOV71843.1 membrane protein [Streptomyces sp. AS58]